MMMKLLWILSTCLLLAGCSAQQVQYTEHSTPRAHGAQHALNFDETQFGEPPEIIAVEDIFRLTGEQEVAFFTYFHSPLRWKVATHERVYTYLQDITMEFGYQGETLTAEQALTRSSGNCLSLAILTTALARLANVEIAYQLMDSMPIYESHGDIVYKGQHVRTKLFLPPAQLAEGMMSLSRQSVLIDYYPTDGSRFVGNISENEYIAMYYNNLASEAIAREDYNTAFWLLQKVLELTPYDHGAINSLAVVHRRIGDLEKAEDIYRFGIEHLENKVSFLRNYRVLLEQQGRYDEVQQINQRLAELDDANPFDWLHAGHNAFSEKNFQEAALFYKKAARMAPYLHESYAGLAKAYYMIGDRERAKREFKKALEYTQRPATKSMYEAKLIVLSQGS